MATLAPPKEIAVQAWIIDALRVCVHPVDVRAVPNGARVSLSTARKLKREGMMPGTPDLIVSWPGGVGFVEVKRPGYSPSSVSPEQRALIALWASWGINVGIAASVDDALRLMRSWGAPVVAKPATNGLEKRFWAFVTKRGDDDCWVWTASTDRRGYGKIYNEGSLRVATHIALELDGRPQPSGKLYACHSCDNPGCVNPKHLWWGTPTENALDCKAKGRADWSGLSLGRIKGIGNPKSVLNADQLSDILTSRDPVSVIAERNPCGKSTIHKYRRQSRSHEAEAISIGEAANRVLAGLKIKDAA